MRKLLTSSAGLLLVTAVAAGSFAAGKGKSQRVSIKDMSFSPASITVSPGDTVIWSNDDDRDHTVIAADGSFASPNIRTGGSYSAKFDKAGRFPYACQYHPRMKGVIVVSSD